MGVLIFTSTDSFSYTCDVLRVGRGAGFVELSGDEESVLFSRSDVFDGQSVVLSCASKEVLAPFDGRGIARAFGIEKRYQDLVSYLRRCHDFLAK